MTVKVKCEMLIPAPEHYAFLTSWRGLVGEGVRLEYQEAKLRNWPRCLRRKDDDDLEWGYDENELDNEDEDEGNGDGDADEEDEDGDEEDDTGDPDEGCVGWDEWPDNWPATVVDVGERMSKSTTGTVELVNLGITFIRNVLSCCFIRMCVAFAVDESTTCDHHLINCVLTDRVVVWWQILFNGALVYCASAGAGGYCNATRFWQVGYRVRGRCLIKIGGVQFVEARSCRRTEGGW